MFSNSEGQPVSRTPELCSYLAPQPPVQEPEMEVEEVRESVPSEMQNEAPGKIKSISESCWLLVGLQPWPSLTTFTTNTGTAIFTISFVKRSEILSVATRHLGSHAPCLFFVFKQQISTRGILVNWYKMWVSSEITSANKHLALSRWAFRVGGQLRKEGWTFWNPEQYVEMSSSPGEFHFPGRYSEEVKCAGAQRREASEQRDKWRQGERWMPSAPCLPLPRHPGHMWASLGRQPLSRLQEFHRQLNLRKKRTRGWVGDSFYSILKYFLWLPGRIY